MLCLYIWGRSQVRNKGGAFMGQVRNKGKVMHVTGKSMPYQLNRSHS